MKILEVTQNSEEWLEARKGRITGSKLGDIASKVGFTKEALIEELESLKIEVPKYAKKEELQALLPKTSLVKLMLKQPKKIGFYQLIADEIALIGDEDEDPRDKGHRLEEEAVNQLEEHTGIKYRRGLFCQSDDHEDIALSPDGLSDDCTHMAEAKCLMTAKHLQVIDTNELPSDFEEQKLQYFIVNEKGERLDFVFYDPLVTSHPIHVITFYREDLLDEIALFKEYQLGILKARDEMIEKLTF